MREYVFSGFTAWISSREEDGWIRDIILHWSVSRCLSVSFNRFLFPDYLTVEFHRLNRMNWTLLPCMCCWWAEKRVKVRQRSAFSYFLFKHLILDWTLICSIISLSIFMCLGWIPLSSHSLLSLALLISGSRIQSPCHFLLLFSSFVMSCM